MRLRAARTSDAPTICSIHNEIIENSLVTFTTALRTPRDVATEIASRGPAFLCAENDGLLVGFATYAPFRSGPGYRHTREHSIHLAPAMRGKGIGRSLIIALEDVARKQGVHVLIGGVSSANPAAIAFHEALGYDQASRLVQVGRKHGRWLDLILMQKILSAGPDSSKSSG